jgi:phage terminase large subunit-like protein
VGYSAKGDHWFDHDTANRAIDMIETHCRYIDHLDPAMVGRPVRLEPHQKERIENVFGWKRKDNPDPELCSRQYRTLYLEEPRGNGKSTEAACIVLVMLFQDREAGGQIYSAATEMDQARIIFNIAKEMILLDEGMSGKVEILKDSIYFPQWGTAYKPIPASHQSKHGLNASCIIVDEVHVHENRELIDVLRTSTVKRRQPLEIYTTTAGVDRSSICWELHQRAQKVIAGELVDDAFLPYVYGATLKDDWKSEKTWIKANPNWGISVKPDYIREECERAQQTPAYQNNFKRLHLNIWTTQQDLWIDQDRWDACRGIVDMAALEGRECFGALDLSSVLDLSCFLLLFPVFTGEKEERDVIPQFKTKTERIQWFEAYRTGRVKPEKMEVKKHRFLIEPRFYIPADNIHERIDRDKVPYDAWVRDGLVTATPGAIIDYDFIRYDINEMGERYDIREIAIDRWNATQITTQLAGDGFEVFFHGQGFASMGQPSRDFEAMVRAKRIVHAAHPVMDWMIGNVAVKIDPAGFPKPDKGGSTERIDGVVCNIMALGRAMLAEADDATSIPDDYEVVVA